MARNDDIWDDVEDVLNGLAALATVVVGGAAIGMAAAGAISKMSDESQKALTADREIDIDDF